MRLTILGSGTSIPTFDRGAPGVLVRAGGRTVLVDLGPGTLSRLPRLGVDLGDVDVVLFTHFHTDHAADLAPLLFALKSPVTRDADRCGSSERRACATFTPRSRRRGGRGSDRRRSRGSWRRSVTGRRWASAAGFGAGRWRWTTRRPASPGG
jgi:glyoxylase-like metal-dependent hydrolase (beta-lactamase superfamily II)